MSIALLTLFLLQMIGICGIYESSYDLENVILNFITRDIVYTFALRVIIVEVKFLKEKYKELVIVKSLANNS